MITEDGDVYSLKSGKLRKIKLQTNEKGYKRVGIQINCKRYLRSVHRLVAQTYIPNPDNLPQINHIDEDKTNNNVTNLEWCNSQYNNEYSKAKSYIVENVKTGERQTVYNLSEFARHINGSVTGLLKTLKRRQYTYKGYKLIARID